MEYISAEEFLKQPEKVQRVFLDYWVPEKGEMIYSTGISSGKYILLAILGNNAFYVISLDDFAMCRVTKNVFIPLFTEVQLRKFIEDKTKEVTYTGATCGGDRFVETEYEDFTSIRREQVMDKDLLMAYWKYACRLIKEGLNDN